MIEKAFLLIDFLRTWKAKKKSKAERKKKRKVSSLLENCFNAKWRVGWTMENTFSELKAEKKRNALFYFQTLVFCLDMIFYCLPSLYFFSSICNYDIEMRFFCSSLSTFYFLFRVKTLEKNLNKVVENCQHESSRHFQDAFR